MIFEREPHIGGRSTTVQPFNDTSTRPVELGASIFVDVNHILQQSVKEFNLTLKEPYSTVRRIRDGVQTNEKFPFMGIYDGSQFVIKMADAGWWSSAKMLWRYGMAPYYANKLMQKTVAKFLAIYEAPYFPFPSLTKRVYDLGLSEVVGTTGAHFLKENGIGEAFGREVIQAMTRVNYAINLGAVHGLEGMVSIATEGASAVEGGNWRIFEGMVNSSGADVKLETAVKSVQRHADGTFTLTSKGAASQKADTATFDTLVLASPYQFTNLDISPKPAITPDTIPYVNLHVTLFTSPHYLSSAAFGLPEEETVPSMLLTTLQDDETPGADPFYSSRVPFNSISLLGTRFNRRTGGDQYLYKIFSMAPISDEFLARLMGVKTPLREEDVSWVHRKLWQSYPFEVPRVTFEELRLDENLWYTGGMESFIRCRETMALMGKNVANLVVEEWVSGRTKMTTVEEEDEEGVQERLQVEL